MVSSELQAAGGLVYGRLRGLQGGQDHCIGRQQFSFLPMCFSCHYEGSQLTSASLPVSKKHLYLWQKSPLDILAGSRCMSPSSPRCIQICFAISGIKQELLISAMRKA